LLELGLAGEVFAVEVFCKWAVRALFLFMGLATDTRLHTLERLLERTLAGLGYELADFNCSNRGRMLRVFIDKVDEHFGPTSGHVVSNVANITLADCEAVTRQLQRVLDVERIEYDRMEVSSPGLDRKLRKPADFVRFAGQEAEVRLREPVNGRRRFVGVVRQVIGEQVEIEVNGARMLLALENLDKARLVPKYDMQGRRSR
jgi:ribosome maturation factor RimP